jgi:hypothetical protein
MKFKRFIKKVVLSLFLSFFEEELDSAEPKVEKFFADLLKPYL